MNTHIVSVCAAALLLANSAYSAAIMAQYRIELDGGPITVDSYDSADPAKSTNGRYDPAKASDNGDLRSSYWGSDAVVIRNNKIYGRVHTQSGSAISIGSLGVIGSHAWHASGSNGIQPGYSLTPANLIFPSVSFPYTNGKLPQSGEVSALEMITNVTLIVQATNPPNASPDGYSLGAVTTNTHPVSTSTYPGLQPVLTTNWVWVTSSQFPGSIADLVTNCATMGTVSTYPGAQMCLTTNFSNPIASRAYKGPHPGLVTNEVVETECGSTLRSDLEYPIEGSYCAAIPPWQTNGLWHWFDAIHTTNITYVYYSVSYSYATQLTYSYPSPTYHYHRYSYDYPLYQIEPVTVTNFYDHILHDGDYYATNLVGSTIVLGDARLVMPEGLEMEALDQITITEQASLTLFFGGRCFLYADRVRNQTGRPQKFEVRGPFGAYSFRLMGSGHFIGSVIAPSAQATISGSADGNLEYSGVLIAESVSVKRAVQFHFDEQLRHLGTPAPHRAPLVNPSFSPGTGFQFQVLGFSGWQYVVETSTNLMDWTPIFTNMSSFHFAETNVFDGAARYYRAVSLP